MSTNTYYLTDGSHFIIDPKKEQNPTEAYRTKLRFLTTISPETLSKDPRFNTESIRALTTGMVAVTVNSKRLTKKETIESLAALIESERASKVLLLQEFIDDHGIAAKDLDIYFHALALLADEDFIILINESLKQTYKTPKSFLKTGLPNLFKAMEKDERYLQHQMRLKHIRKVMNLENKEGFQKINTDYKDDVKEFHKCRKEIKESVVMEFAKKVLSSVRPDWRDVALAISLVTGRRQAEVLGDHSEWSIKDDSTLNFKGILKGKGREEGDLINKWVEVHCLIDSQLILNGLEQIDRSEVRIGHERVNARYSKDFSTRKTTAMMKLYHDSGLEKYKDSRDFYSAYLSRNVYVQDSLESEEHFIMKSIHHEDLVSAMSYRKFKLVD